MPVRRQSAVGKHAGKIAFAVAVAAGVAYSLFLMSSEKGTQQSIDEVKRISGELQKRLQAKGAESLPPMRDKDSVLGAWQRIPKPRPDLSPWLYERPPDVIVKVEIPVDPRKDLFPPADVQAKALPDFKVELTWKPDPRTTARVKGYDVFRWKEGEEPAAKPLSERLMEGPPFVDEDTSVLEPMGKYCYAVRAHTDEEIKQPEKAARSAPAPVALPDDRDVEYYGESGVEMAVLYVKRFHKGGWRFGQFSVYLGDPVGGEAVVELSGDEKTRLNCATVWILVEIGQEVKTRKEKERVPKRNDKGAQEFDKDGKPEYEEREVERKVVEEYVVLVDGEGNPKRVVRTGRPVPPPVDVGKLDEKDPFLLHKLGDLRKRIEETKEPALAGQLRKRAQFLERQRSKLAVPGAKTVEEAAKAVDEALLNVKNGLLFELRWKWLEACDKALRFRNRPDFQREADDLMAYIKDLEEFLSPAGWDKEKGEWGIDQEEFGKKNKRDAPQWNQMPERPEKPRNHLPRPK